MVEEAEHSIDQIRQVAERFIKKHYAEEERFFRDVWEAFENWVRQLKVPIEKIIFSEALRTRAGLGFVGEEGLDLVSPIVLSTIAETLQESRKSNLSVSDLERIVGKAATRAGAAGELLARLLSHLPEIVIAVRNARADVSQAYISLAQKPQYEIWTGGEHEIVDSISEYEQEKDQYLFWIDVTNGDYTSLGEEKSLKPTARKLLMFLTENIGMSVPRREAFEKAVGASPEERGDWKNLLSQYVGQLHDFAEEEFRDSYLVHDSLSDTLALKKDFKDKYFIFITLRPSEKKTDQRPNPTQR